VTDDASTRLTVSRISCDGKHAKLSEEVANSGFFPSLAPTDGEQFAQGCLPSAANGIIHTNERFPHLALGRFSSTMVQRNSFPLAIRYRGPDMRTLGDGSYNVTLQEVRPDSD
jgi:hypothetical protein